MELLSFMSVPGAGVFVGVVLEGTEYPPPIHKRWPALEKIGFLILILSLVADWHFQSAINERQTQELIAANNRIARQGPRAELLYGDSRKTLVAALKKQEFAGQKMETRYCGISFSRAYVDEDTMSVAMRLPDVFREAGGSADFPVRRE